MRPPLLTPIGQMLSAATVLFVLGGAAIIVVALEVASLVTDQLDAHHADVLAGKKKDFAAEKHSVADVR